VGWDRRVAVWQETTAKKTTSVHSMPPPNSHHLIGHNDDILCVTSCDSNHTLATGGYDGALCLWHFDSATFVCKMWATGSEDSFIRRTRRQSRAIEQVKWLPRKRALLTCGAGGFLRVWDIGSHQMMYEQDAKHKRGESLLTLSVEEEEKLIFVGDTCGRIKVFSIEGLPTLHNTKGDKATRKYSFKNAIVQQAYWQAHKESVVGIDFISKLRMIVTASTDGAVWLWTLTGACVGMFGTSTWDAGDPKTWLAEADLLAPTFVDAEEYRMNGLQTRPYTTTRGGMRTDAGMLSAQAEEQRQVVVAEKEEVAAASSPPKHTSAGLVVRGGGSTHSPFDDRDSKQMENDALHTARTPTLPRDTTMLTALASARRSNGPAQASPRSSGSKRLSSLAGGLDGSGSPRGLYTSATPSLPVLPHVDSQRPQVLTGRRSNSASSPHRPTSPSSSRLTYAIRPRNKLITGERPAPRKKVQLEVYPMTEVPYNNAAQLRHNNAAHSVQPTRRN